MDSQQAWELAQYHQNRLLQESEDQRMLKQALAAPSRAAHRPVKLWIRRMAMAIHGLRMRRPVETTRPEGLGNR